MTCKYMKSPALRAAIVCVGAAFGMFAVTACFVGPSFLRNLWVTNTSPFNSAGNSAPIPRTLLSVIAVGRLEKLCKDSSLWFMLRVLLAQAHPNQSNCQQPG